MKYRIILTGNIKDENDFDIGWLQQQAENIHKTLQDIMSIQECNPSNPKTISTVKNKSVTVRVSKGEGNQYNFETWNKEVK